MKSDILSVLVVDDELPIRQELAMFDWGACGAGMVGQASNGEEALEFCCEYVPDVVVTDITMPKMDGITLIHRLNEQFPRIKVIILTCHSDFNYARDALQMGAVDYIVKVMLRDEDLARALGKAHDAIEREQLYRMSAKEKRRKELTRLFVQADKMQEGAPEVLSRSSEASEWKLDYPLGLVYLYVGSKPSNRIFIDQEISTYLDACDGEYDWFPAAAGIYCLLFNNCTRGEEELCKIVAALVTALYKHLDDNLSFVNGRVAIHSALAGIVSNSGDFAQALEQKDMWADACFYQNEEAVMSGNCPAFTLADKETKQRIRQSLSEIIHSGGDIWAFIQEHIKDWAANKRILPMDLKTLSLEILNDTGEKNPHNESATLRVFHAQNLEELTEVLAKELGGNCSKTGSYRVEIRMAMRIIAESFDQPLSLSFIAEKVGLSSNYFSRLFSEEVGESYNDHITRIRMEKAIEMLQHTNLKVYEVAEKVGIPNYRYFTSIFRNWTGVAPKDYKRR